MHRWRAGHRAAARPLAVVLGVLGVAALTLLTPSAPGYDAWSWLIWGREVAALDLDTVDGPAFKPLPVLVTALLSPLGDAAPDAWLVVARAGTIAAVLLAARLAWRLTRETDLPGTPASRRPPGETKVPGTSVSLVAAGVAATGLLLSHGWWWHAAIGNAEGLFLALVLGAVDRGLDRRHGQALALALAAGLLRPEVWPFLGLYGLWLLRSEPGLRAPVVAAAAALPALWFLPELWGSGDVMRSSDRARIPNPGQPATADRPALASLDAASAIPLLPVAVLAGAALLVRDTRTRLLAAGGFAWVLLIALMAERGYSGEPRYALPGAALLAVPAAVAAARAPRAVALVAVAAVAGFALARTDQVDAELRGARADAGLWNTLPAAIAAAGGRDALLAHGRPITGRLRGPGVAYALRVHKRVVGFDPAQGGVLLRSRIRPGAPVRPVATGGAEVLARSARWEIRTGRPRLRSP